MLPFGIFNGYLVYFSHFGMFYRGKSGNRDTHKGQPKVGGLSTQGDLIGRIFAPWVIVYFG
jgi:hypothetical protein